MWITGDFDGDYEGEPRSLASARPDPSRNLRSYRVKITKGFLSNVTTVDAPPIALDAGEKRPFTYRVMHPVDVEISTKNNKVATGRVTLRDFRLHHWAVVGSSESDSSFDSKILGRISGRAYGLLVPDEEASSRPIIDTPSLVSASAYHEPPATGGETRLTQQLHKRCFTCSVWPNLILMILIAVQCRFWVALAYALFMSFVCWLDEQATDRGSKIQTFRWRMVWSVAILILALLGIYENRVPWLHEICQVFPTLSVGLTALALLLSVRVYSCMLKCTLLLLMLIALNGWCHFNGTCQSNTGSASIQNTSLSPWNQTHAMAHDFASSLYASFQGLPSRLSTVQELPTRLSNEISSLANPAPSSLAGILLESSPQEYSPLEAGHLVSLDDAIRNARLLDDCRTRVYIPFDYSVGMLGPATEERLNRLGPQLSSRQGGVYVLTGHSDTSGDETPEGYLMNIQLSGTRAEAVRSFLVNGGFLSLKSVDLRSAGSSMPLTTALDSLRFNRRVELNLRCNTTNKSQLGN
jgi:outer membrane protein OmpA-like peptidoglycan-associated protein